jgi:hypothetical protein
MAPRCPKPSPPSSLRRDYRVHDEICDFECVGAELRADYGS